MDVVSLCPLRAASLVWQPRRGTWVMTAVCKATYMLIPMEAPLAREQEYPNEDDNHWNDDPARSLYSPNDLVPFKPRADVMLVGHAFAPRKEPVRSLVVRLIVGDVNKAIEVFGERAWSHEAVLREGPRFVKMPLRYERATGGPETSNPVGMRLDARPDSFGNVQIPNLQPPGMLLSDPNDFIESIGFGPIAPSWPGRRDKLGRHGASWKHGSWNEQPIPDDIDPSYFMAAPRDQQVDSLRPNERIILENLHPDHPRLVTALPGVTPQAFVDRRGAAPHELALTCDTLWIDTDRSICTVTWRGTLPLEHPQQQGRVVIGLAEPGQRLTWSDLERLAARGEDKAEQPLAPARGQRREQPASPPGKDKATPRSSTLPFIATGPDGYPIPPPLPKKKEKPARPPRDDADHTHEDFTDTGFVRPAAAALPFNEMMGAAGAPAFAGNAGPGMPFKDGTSTRTGETDAPPPAADASPAWLMPAPRSPGPGTLGPPVAPPAHASAPSSPGGEPFAFSAPGAPKAAPPPAFPSAPPAVSPPQMAAPTSDSPWAGGGGAYPNPPRSLDSSPGASSFGSPSGAPGFGGQGGGSTFGTSVPIPPPVAVTPPAVVGSAAAGGVVAASNAAAANGWVPAVAPVPPAAPPIASRPLARPGSREVVELLWFQPEIMERVRDHRPWKETLAELKPKPPENVAFDDELPVEPSQEVKDRRDIVGVLTRVDPVDSEGVNEAISDAVTEEGLFVPPLVIVAGELSLPFDELETLKANVTAVTPLVAGDKKLKETVDTVNELLKTPWLQSSTGVAEGQTQRVREAFAQANRILPASYLDTHTDRILLEQRAYQKRTVFGDPWIRSLLVPNGGSAAIPTYLPEALSKQLPMFQKFKVRIIAEAVLQQDEYESHPVALKVVALGRLMAVTGTPRRR